MDKIIASVRDFKSLELAVKSKVNVIFLLNGDISHLTKISKFVKEHNKLLYIHVDLIDGLNSDEAAVRYLLREVKCNGVISTKRFVLYHAKKLGLMTVQRFFILDSQSFDNMLESLKAFAPDYVEILPGVLHLQTIKDIRQKVKLPIIAGGLIRSSDDVETLLNNQIDCISSSDPKLWGYKDNKVGSRLV